MWEEIAMLKPFDNQLKYSNKTTVNTVSARPQSISNAEKDEHTKKQLPRPFFSFILSKTLKQEKKYGWHGVACVHLP